MHARLQYSGVLLGEFSGPDRMPYKRAVEQAIDQTVAKAIAGRVEAAWREARTTDTDPMGWHRDARWSDSRISPDIHHWHHWSHDTTIHFTLRDGGVLQ